MKGKYLLVTLIVLFSLNCLNAQNTYDILSSNSVSMFTYMLHDLAAAYTPQQENILCIGMGIGIPHGKCNAAKRLVAAFGISKQGIDFDALDGEPVYIFVCLVAPEDSAGPHLKALATATRSQGLALDRIIFVDCCSGFDFS